MPAIQVARTDTFEQQRVKINEIGDQIFNVTAGGSDLSTGLLKLGDGTKNNPSLAFTSDESLGIFKANPGTFGFVSASKKIFDASLTNIITFKDFIVRKQSLNQGGLSITNTGSGYDGGQYTNIPLIGGSGDNALLTIDVVGYNGTILNTGTRYIPGAYASINLVGGNGTGSQVSFNIDNLGGDITDAGSAYAPGIYSGVPLQGGDGTGAEATITVSGEASITGSITNGGSGGTDNSYPFVQLHNTPAQTFVVTSIPNPNAGQPGEPNSIYQIDGVTKPTLNIVPGNTYVFDMSDSSLLGSNPGDPTSEHRILFQAADGTALDSQLYTFYTRGSAGQAGSFTDLIIKPEAPVGVQIRYDCANHPNMSPAGGNINVNAGSVGNFGTSAYADITVSGGAITSLSFVDEGSGYRAGDTLYVKPSDVGNNTGFLYTVNSINFTGTVNSVVISNEGNDYNINNVLTINDSDIGGGGGSGFEYTVNTNPGRVSNLQFDQYGTGYIATDLLELPKKIANLSSYLPGETDPQASTATSGDPVLTISDTSALEVGMYCFTSPGDVGALDNTATIQSIDSSTQITMNTGAISSGAINVYFVSQDLNNITVTSTAGIAIGDSIIKVSGIGVLEENTTVGDIIDSTTIQLSSQSVSPGPIVLDFAPPFGDPSTDFQYRVDTLGVIDSVTLEDGGNGYAVDDILSIQSELLTQPNTFIVTSRAVQEMTFLESIPDSVLEIGDTVKVRDGAVSNISIVSSPTITPTVTGPLSGTTTSGNTTVTGLSSTSNINVGDFVTEVSTSGNIDPLAKVASITNSSTIVMDLPALANNTIDLNFTSDEGGTFIGVATTGGTGVGLTLDIERSSQGDIFSILVNSSGSEYTQNDPITVAGDLVGGTTPADDITLTADSVSSTEDLEIIERITSGGNISKITVLIGEGVGVTDGDTVIKVGTTTPVYTVDLAGSQDSRFYIDLNDGNGSQKTPNITMYVGSTYRFDVSDASNSAHQLSLSEFPDGINPPSFIDNISSTLDVNSTTITVADTTGIVVGMVVSVEQGDGQVASNTLVASVDSLTQITLSELPDQSGAVILQFSGTEYTDGVTREQGILDIFITEDTPSLYYYCGIGGEGHENEGGPDGAEAVITIDPNNPKTFGSGFQIRVSDITSTDQVTFSVSDGSINSDSVVASTSSIVDMTTTSLEAATIVASSSVEVPQITSQNLLQLQGSSISLNSDTTCGLLSITNSSGAIETAGEIKTLGQLNVNDILFFNNNIVTSASNNPIIFQPSANQVVTVNATTALAVPVGDTAQRPLSAVSGQIRFNTDTDQYEGYSETASAWSSLGGVRDLDGNTFIKAEESIGSNDNTLWFINDNINTVRFTPQTLEFRSNKLISSANVTAPSYINWAANAPVSLGEYLKYKNNLYEVTTAGTTGTSGSEPTHTIGSQPNGTAVLEFWGLSVAPLTFQDIEEVRIGPTQETPLIINQELRLANNTISTDVSDLELRPNSGKKVVIESDTSLVIPNGTTPQRGVAEQGSIRFNITTSTYEGYDGVNWGSLGGVKDVDQNTYIIPELSAGSNENILYFYNDGNNTLQLTTTALDFFTVDTIRSQTSGEFEITAGLMTFNNAETTLDNTDTDRTFIHTSKQYLDLGLSAGLSIDPVLRLDDQGDVYLNTTFGTGTFSGVKVLDGELKEFELADIKIVTEKINLVKGTINNGNSILYDVTLQKGCKTTVIVENDSTGDREFIEFGIIDNGTDVFHTEYGNIRTGVKLIVPTFEVTPQNQVRIAVELGSDVGNTETVNITFVSHITKK